MDRPDNAADNVKAVVTLHSNGVVLMHKEKTARADGDTSLNITFSINADIEIISRLVEQRDGLLAALKRFVPSCAFKEHGVWFEGSDAVASQVSASVAQALDAIAAVEKPAAPSDADGWIEWKGGECPVPGDTLVNVRSKNCAMNSSYGFAADELDWSHGDHQGYDIVAYRVVQEGGAQC